MFSRLKIRTKLILLLSLSVLAVLLSIAAATNILRDRVTEDRVDKLRAVAQSTLAIAKALEAQVAAKALTHEQAFAQLRTTMQQMRFDGGTGYVAMVTLEGVVLVQPVNPSLEGKLSVATDGHGHLMGSLYADAVRSSEEGVVRYETPKPGETAPQAKLSYVAAFRPWNAVFVCGAYTADLDVTVWATVLRLSEIGGVLLLLTLTLGWLVNRDIGKALGGLRDTMTRLAGGDLAVTIPGIKRTDELGGMARAIGVFKDNAGQVIALQQEQQTERQRSIADRRNALLELADRFDTTVGRLVGVMATGATELEVTAKTMTSYRRSHQPAGAGRGHGRDGSRHGGPDGGRGGRGTVRLDQRDQPSGRAIVPRSPTVRWRTRAGPT